MTDDTQRTLGKLEGRVDALEVDIKEISGDVKAILAIMNQTKGGWKTLALVGSIGGAFGAFLVKVFPFTGSLPR